MFNQHISRMGMGRYTFAIRKVEEQVAMYLLGKVKI